MGKKYWLLTVMIFVLGIGVGVGGHILWGTTLGPNADSTADKDNASKVDTVGEETTLPFTLPDNTDSTDPSDPADSANITDPADTADQSDSDLGTNLPTDDVQLEIVAQYKQALGILFDAWKAKDMATFRSAIEGAYTGELMEKHIAKAEGYIPEGIGLDISNIVFDEVKVESTDNYTATVDAIYRYTARDYDLNTQKPVGLEQVHEVHVRANLVKIATQWMITGETTI
ncbi:hypothetical protein LPY66_19365 [Dehalobacter sp. DCM]|uniref:hypothetical protein n=1 Tax=Dehalobacter sp. DCM TaxID=2907827 RepID=UPI003081D3B9|nr:hypothetical protein LPY66_19365 [Dehalobacter sp. DCM]